MKSILIVFAVCLLSCKNEQTIDSAESYYSFYSPALKDTVYCLQIGSSTIDEFGVVGYKYVKEELVDTTSAYVKIEGEFIESHNQTLTFLVNGDTLVGQTAFEMKNHSAFRNRKILLAGRLKLNPSFYFKINSMLIMGIKKASVNH